MDTPLEQEFVRACLAHRLCPEQPLPAPAQGLDWESAYGLLVRNGLTSLFYRLGRDEPGLWPLPLQRRLRNDYEAARLWGEQCAPEVSAALAALHQAGLPVLVLKGWALIPTIYEDDPGQRLCGDLDLLVAPRDAAGAGAILYALGYGAKPEPWPGFERRYRYCRVYTRPRRPWPFRQTFALAVHWGLLDTPYYLPRIDLTGLLERSLAVRVAGRPAAALGHEDHLVYACGHLALHHGYDDALYRYFELAAVILGAAPGVDWAAVAARAAEWRLVLPVQRVLARLHALWPWVMPAQALGPILALRPAPSERLIHGWVVRWRENNAARAVLAWLTMPGLGRRWGFLVESAFPGPDYLRRRYGPAPGGLWPLHYLRRFGRAARSAVAALGKHTPAGRSPAEQQGSRDV